MAANPTASADAKAILNWLAALPDRLDKRVISGQYIVLTEYSVRVELIAPQSFEDVLE